MEDYQKRVFTEQEELGEKIVKLTTFLTSHGKVDGLEEKDWQHLYHQLRTMMEYNSALLIRIRTFTW